jgi:hypothetical protein
MIINRTYSIASTYMDFANWADPEFVPHCLSLNLTLCTIWDLAFPNHPITHNLQSALPAELCNTRKIQPIVAAC